MPRNRRAITQAMWPRRVGSSAAYSESANEWYHCSYVSDETQRASIRRWCGCSRHTRCSASLVLLGERADRIHSRGADFIHHLDDHAVLGAGIALNVDRLVKTSGDAILDLRGDFFLADHDFAKENVATASDRHDDCVILVGILHLQCVVHPGHVYRHVLLQHRSDHHEDDQQNQHDVSHGYDVWSRHLCPDLWLIRHNAYFLAPRRRIK